MWQQVGKANLRILASEQQSFSPINVAALAGYSIGITIFPLRQLSHFLSANHRFVGSRANNF